MFKGHKRIADRDPMPLYVANTTIQFRHSIPADQPAAKDHILKILPLARPFLKVIADSDDLHWRIGAACCIKAKGCCIVMPVPSLIIFRDMCQNADPSVVQQMQLITAAPFFG